MRKSAVVLLILLILVFAAAREFRLGCPTLGNPGSQAGWSALHVGRLAAADSAFSEALARCPEHAGALTGLGYVALRLGREREAGRRFDAVLSDDSTVVDALVGRGIVAWRRGEYQRVYDLFRLVKKLDPKRAEAEEYLSQLPDGLGPAPARPSLVVPDTTVYASRALANRFEVRTATGWAPFYVKGVNLGPALPGKHPSEFPDSATYAEWIAGIREMGANTIRVYTIHPPRFYGALAADNRAHPDQPIWLIHGVWAENPPGDDYDDPAWSQEFRSEMERVVDLLHGRADIVPRPGHTGGHYTTDVSRWTLAFIIGREWEPQTVEGYLAKARARAPWSGTYLSLRDGNAMDVWLAKACDHLVAYEMSRYRAQRPVAYTNWPTLDPLHHVTEATAQEEAALRKQRGEHGEMGSTAFADDAISLDASLVSPTTAYPAGYFASYHIYPYAPDFMGLDRGYARARSRWGRSSYYGYLLDLKRHHAGLPVLVSEYGVPTSVGIAHIQPGGWHHGGHSEAEAAMLDARMTREIAAAGMAGGIVFEWLDEWFKKNWLTRPLAIPLERNRMWLNVMDPEQRYGILAMEAGAAGADSTLRKRRPDWDAHRPLYQSGDGAALRAYADPAYLRVLYEAPRGKTPPELLVGFDVSRQDAGAFRWPGLVGGTLPVGVEYVLQVGPGGARLLADPAANPFHVFRLPGGGPLARLGIQAPPAGMFEGRWSYRLNFPMPAERRADGVFDSLRVITNRVRLSRDGTEYPALGYDRGILPAGPAPIGLWERDRDAVEVRIPWTLLGVTDPSSLRVLQVGGPAPKNLDDDDALATETAKGIRIVAARRAAGGAWAPWPESGKAGDVAMFSWSPWEAPLWHQRRRPTFDALQRAFGEIDGRAPVPRTLTVRRTPDGLGTPGARRRAPTVRGKPNLLGTPMAARPTPAVAGTPNVLGTPVELGGTP